MNASSVSQPPAIELNFMLAHTHTLACTAQSIGPIFSLPRCHYGNPLLLFSQHAPPAHHSRYCPVLSNPLGCRETIPKHDWKEWIVGVAGGKEKLLKGAGRVYRSRTHLSLYLGRDACRCGGIRRIIKCEQKPVGCRGTLFSFQYLHTPSAE